MADSEEFTATVVRAWDDTSTLRGIELEIDAAVHVGHTTPGQYVKLTMASLEGVPIRGYVALASMPALGRRVELLVKRGSALGDALAAAREGDMVRTSRVEGRALKALGPDNPSTQKYGKLAQDLGVPPNK